MKISSIILVIVVSAACTRKNIPVSTSPAAKSGNTRTTTVESLDANTYWLMEAAVDSSYGYAQTNPVKVGSKGGSGPLNERRFLNALMGPNGEATGYFRTGSCCPFETPNGLMGGRGLLDIYRVFIQGGGDTVSIYINMYDEGDLYIPRGFSAKK